MSQPGIGKCRQRGSTGRNRVRKLGLEPLESRQLLTLAEFHIHFLEDLDGVPGAALEENTLEVDDSFFVEIVAEDIRENPSGLHGISLDIMWDPDVFAVADPFDASAVVTDSLPLLSFGILEPELGRINDLGGSAGVGLGVGDVVGQHRPERFALIRFETLRSAEDSRFKLRGGKHDIAFFPPIWDRPSDFHFDQQSITVVLDDPQPDPRTALSESLNQVVNPPSEQVPAFESHVAPQGTSVVPAPEIRTEHPAELPAGTLPSEPVESERAIEPEVLPESAAELDSGISNHSTVVDESERPLIYGPDADPARYLIFDRQSGELRSLSAKYQAAVDAIFAEADAQSGNATDLSDSGSCDEKARADVDPLGALEGRRPTVPTRFEGPLLYWPRLQQDSTADSWISIRLADLAQLISVLAEEADPFRSGCTG